jgi:hypothetical protein
MPYVWKGGSPQISGSYDGDTYYLKGNGHSIYFCWDNAAAMAVPCGRDLCGEDPMAVSGPGLATWVQGVHLAVRGRKVTLNGDGAGRLRVVARTPRGARIADAHVHGSTVSFSIPTNYGTGVFFLSVEGEAGRHFSLPFFVR